MTVYLGRPGALQVVPGTGLKVKPGLLRVSGAATTIGGGRARDYIGTSILRDWTLTWAALDRNVYSFIEAFYAGLCGPGPYVFLDPARTNLLTPNQSGCTSVSDGAEGFTAAGVGESLSSSSTTVRRGPKVLAWALPASPAGGVLRVDAPNADWAGVPAVVGRDYRLQAQIRGAGTDSTVTVTAALVWLDAAGGTVSTSTGSGVATDSGAWAQVLCTGTAPAGAVYVRPELRVTSATVGVGGGTVLVDELQLAMPDALDDGTVWRTGLGVPRVSLPALDDTPWHVSLHRTGLVLEEVS